MSAYRSAPETAAAPRAVPWWRALLVWRVLLGWLDARRARQRAEAEHERQLAAVRWARDRAWGHWYARSSYVTDEAWVARRAYLQLDAAAQAAAETTST